MKKDLHRTLQRCYSYSQQCKSGVVCFGEAELKLTQLYGKSNLK